MATLALIGAGHIHTPGFVKKMAAAEDVQVKLVWDHQAERAKAHAEALGASVAADPESVITDSDVDAVVICSETDKHEKLVLAGAAAGKHLFVEKPLGMGAADSYRMVEAIEKAGVLFQTGYFMRGNPVHMFLKEQIAKGTFGKITRMRHSNCHSGSLGGWFDTEWRWMADPKIAGCGAYGDLGTHSLDIILWLMGKATNVTADISIVTSRYEGCDETGEGLIKFESGAVATLAGGWVDVHNPVSLVLSGTEGHACVCNGKLYLKTENIDGADGAEPFTDLPEGATAGFDLFLKAVNGAESTSLVTAREAAHRSAVMEALYKANETKTWVAPDWR